MPLPHPRLSTHASHLCVLGAQVDCTTSPKTCKRFKVEGYPTLLVLHQGEMCVPLLLPCLRLLGFFLLAIYGTALCGSVWACVCAPVCGTWPTSSVND